MLMLTFEHSTKTRPGKLSFHNETAKFLPVNHLLTVFQQITTMNMNFIFQIRSIIVIYLYSIRYIVLKQVALEF